MKTPKEWKDELSQRNVHDGLINQFIIDIQDEAWNEAIRAAAENAVAYPKENKYGIACVNKDSILQLLKK